MNDRPTPLPLSVLGRWILGEVSSRATVFGVPIALFPKPSFDGPQAWDFLGQRLATPVGPAAGPHSQLSQNIALSYLCGGRFIELKTAQARDDIEVSKPCIDAADLGFNCEWSQELRLNQTLGEYLGAELLVHMARCEVLGQDLEGPRDFAFNASLGYDLAGLRSRKMRAYVANLLSRGGPQRQRLAAKLASVWPLAHDAASLPPATTSLSLSTMHGCPSREIEEIASFLLQEYGVPLLLKLNPTVLGKQALLGVLRDELGYARLQVPEEAFAHDPNLEEVVDVVRAVANRARALGVPFGLKLTNTLEVRRPEGCGLSPNQAVVYMSGRALLPLMLRVASLLRQQLGPIPMAASGGLEASSVVMARNCGLGPLTLCTELLRPSGYAALCACVEALEQGPVERVSLEEAAGAAGADPLRQNGLQRTLPKPSRLLEIFDCNAAPCSLACPAGQEAPRYLRAFGKGDPGAALEATLNRNPLPAVTGHVCPATCEAHCMRGYTGEPIAIRELKKLVSKAEMSLDTVKIEVPGKVAIVGTGPAGVACAALLSRRGVQVRLYDKADRAGGVPAQAIPLFRLPSSALELDLSRILEHPLVELELNSDPLRDIGIAGLREMGFEFAVLATGAGQGRPLRLLGEDLKGVLDGLVFLQSVRRGEPVELGNRVLVIGGGSSAVDAARTAKRLMGPRGFVEMVYRRGRNHMPAHQEELRQAEQEGVAIRPLCIPVRFEGKDGRVVGLRVQGAKLEDADSGRPRPVPIEGSEEFLEATAIIVAIGQSSMIGPGIEATADGRIIADEHCRCRDPNVYAIGDATRGPATIIEAIADANAATADILQRLGLALVETQPTQENRLAELLERKARSPARREEDLALKGEKEARRCLSCDVLCGLCAIVCPNRANVIYETKPRVLPLHKIEAVLGAVRIVDAGALRVRQRFQIANLGEACNACGNCATFCPSRGAPHLDKPRLWLNKKPQGERGIKLRPTPTGFVARWESDLGPATLTKKRRGFRLVCGSFDVRLGLGFEVESVACGTPAHGRTLDLRSAAEVAVTCEGLLESALYLFSAPFDPLATRRFPWGAR